MKKTTTIIAFILLSSVLYAQIKPGVHTSKIKITNKKVFLSGDEALTHLLVNPNPNTSVVLGSNSKSNLTEEIIGETTYDLQSNAAVQNRITYDPDNGTITAGWTMSAEYNTSWADRGTGYNYHDGTSWDAYPTARLENSRGGWPSILRLGNGGECAITHNTANSNLNNAYRTTIGTGTWINSTITPDYLIWNRSATGGVDGNTIHMIALTEPAGGTWTGDTVNGLSGALLYYRSQDGGDSWDITDMQLPGNDSTIHNGMSGDCYAITAQGETVVMAYFNDWGDSYIVKSNDNGDNWTKTTFLDFPVDKYVMDSGFDLDNNDTTDHAYSTDNYGALILDPNGDAHVFYGMMQYADDDLADAGSSWYPGENGIAYWNESFGEDVTPTTLQDTINYLDAAGVATPRGRWWSNMMNDHIITAAPDLNGDGMVDGIDSTGGYALYYASRASMPNAGLDGNGNIWLIFSGYTENIDNGAQVYRHLYATKSEDGGSTWKTPVDITPHDLFSGLQECVFGSMYPMVNDKLRIVYQADFEPGLIVRGDEDLVDLNSIYYLEVDTVGLFDNTSTSINEIYHNNNIDDNRIFDLLGREWKTDFANLPKGVYIINRKKVFKTK